MSIYKHPKQLLAVDCIVFGYEDGDLKVLLFKRVLEPAKGEWSLVGGLVNNDESIEESAKRVLHTITGLNDVFLEQVAVFSKPNRDPGDRVISIAFNALIRTYQQDKTLIEDYGAKWFSLSELPELIFDHNDMLELALSQLRTQASHELVGKELLPEKFTLLQLRRLYNALYQKEFDPGNFRKKVLSLRVLEQLKEKDTSESRKGAHYFKYSEKAELNKHDRIFKI